jgi:ketosteroid isomerase-like protein
MTTRTDAFLAYLAAYARKDLDTIDAMLADDVTLRDWHLHVNGKAAALAETARNFAAARTIAIEPLALHEGADSVAGELRIVIDDATELFVVDVLAFDAHDRIRAIRAYLGRGEASPAAPAQET